MAETHAEHHGPSVRAYFYVFGALAVFTALSFVANFAAHHQWISLPVSFVIILAVAVCKAVLVAAFFMHLLLDWKRVYIMIVLLPDIVLAWHHFPPTMVP